MTATAADVLNVERGYLGVAEVPPGSNRTIIGVKYGWNGVAWCAEFVTVCQHEAGNTDFLGSASCYVLVQRYRDGDNGEWLGNPGAGGLRPGDNGFLGSYGQDHTVTVEYVDGDTVHTIEGNWGNKVARVQRPSGAFYGFGRPKYTDAAAPGLPPSSATGGRPVLRLGSTGHWVNILQTYLAGATGWPLAVDGDFGTQTEAVLKAYQTKRGLEVDGICGPATWADIDKVLAYVIATQTQAPPGTVTAVPGPHDIPAFPGTIQLGSQGDAVKHWQYKLIQRGWNIGAADGVAGQKTIQALRSFQSQAKAQGYYRGEVDGIGGPGTWVALFTAPIT